MLSNIISRKYHPAGITPITATRLNYLNVKINITPYIFYCTMSDSLERIITESGNVFGIAADTTKLVNQAIRRHDLGPTAAAALGRALTGAVLLAGLLKDNQSVQLIFEGNGPLGKVVAEAYNSGTARGYVTSPRAEVPLKNGAIDVAGGIGTAGFLHVVKDIGMKEKYTGLVQLYTSEIGDDIAFYLTESEQTPSTIGLGVHLQPDGTALASGGFLIQTLPPAEEEIITNLEKSIRKSKSITSMIAEGQTPAQILSRLFSTIPHKHTASTKLDYRCKCSKDKMEAILTTLSDNDLNYLLEQEDDVQVKCDYCSDNYIFSKEFLQALLDKS